MSENKKTKIKGKVLTITTTETRQLDKYEFVCEKCKTIHKMSSYAVAQLSMGNALVFTCVCNNEIDLEPFN